MPVTRPGTSSRQSMAKIMVPYMSINLLRVRYQINCVYWLPAKSDGKRSRPDWLR
jgi:hypothetical protein